LLEINPLEISRKLLEFFGRLFSLLWPRLSWTRIVRNSVNNYYANLRIIPSESAYLLKTHEQLRNVVAMCKKVEEFKILTCSNNTCSLPITTAEESRNFLTEQEWNAWLFWSLVYEWFCVVCSKKFINEIKVFV